MFLNPAEMNACQSTATANLMCCVLTRTFGTPPPRSASLAPYRLNSVRFHTDSNQSGMVVTDGMPIMHTPGAKHVSYHSWFHICSLFPAGILKALWMISARFVGATGTAWKLQSEHCYRQSCIRQPCQPYLDICIVYGSHTHRLRSNQLQLPSDKRK